MACCTDVVLVPQSTLVTIAVPTTQSVLVDSPRSVVLPVFTIAAMLSTPYLPAVQATGQQGPPGPGGTGFGTLEIVLDNDGAALVAGVTGTLDIFQNCTITGIVLTADQTGSVILDLKRTTYSAYPSGLVSICGSTPPSLSSAQKALDVSLTGWTTGLNAGDVIQVSVASAATITQLTLAIHVSL